MWILPKNYPLSCHFAQAMVESKEDLSLPDLNIESSLMWRSKPSQLQTWQRRWKTASWMPRLCGRILKPSHHTSFETKLTSLLEVIPVHPSQQQANEKAKMTPDTCGHTFENISEQLDLLPASLKMSKATSRLDSPQSLATWKRMVTDARSEYSARKKLAHRTEGKEYLSWPTPVSADHLSNNSETLESWQIRATKKKQEGINLHFALRHAVQKWPTVRVSSANGASQKEIEQGNPKRRLETEVQLDHWPTPRTADAEGGPRTLNEKGQRISKSDPSKTYGANLSDKVHWSTPTVQDSDKATKKIRDNHQNNLTAVVFNPQLPTPTSRDYKGGYKEESLTRTDGKSRRFDALPNAAIGGVGTDIVKGHLNPDWVEQLMGVPPGWTALDGSSNKWEYGWHDGSWEEGIPRVVESCDDRVDRIRLLGNGVVPATAAKAWLTLFRGYGEIMTT